MPLTEDQLNSIVKGRVSALSAGRKDREEEREKKEQEQKRLKSLKESISKKQDYLQPEDLTNLQEAFIARDFDKVKEINNTLAEREEGDSGVIAKGVQFGAGLARGAWEMGDRLVVQPVDALLSQGEDDLTNVEADAEAVREEFQQRSQDIAARQREGELTREQADNLREASMQQFQMEEEKIMGRTEWAGDDESDRLRIAIGAGVEAGFSIAGGFTVKALAAGATKMMTGKAAASVATKTFGKDTIRSQVFRSTLAGAGAGGGVGFGTGLQGDTLDWGKVAKGTATGVVVGGGLGGGLSAAVGRFASKKAGQEAAEGAADAVEVPVTRQTNPSRLLGDGRERLERELAEIEDEIGAIRREDPNAYSSNPEDLRGLQGAEVGTGQFAQDSPATVADASGTAQRARELIRRRGEIQAEITAINQQVLENTAGKRYGYTKDSTYPTTADGKKIKDPAEAKQVKAKEAYDDTVAKLETVKNNPEASEVVTGADHRVGRKIKKLDREFALKEDVTPDDAVKYMQQRTKLVNQLEDPNTELGKKISEKDAQIQQAYDKGDHDAVVRAADERSVLETDAMMQAQRRTNDDIMNGKVTSSVAKNIETEAIARGLSEGFDELPQSDRVSILAQVDRAVDHMKSNPDEAMAIAMGKQEPPEGTFSSAYVVAAERAAVEAGNDDMIIQLGTQSTRLQESTQAGQLNAIFAARDPESPIDAMKTVMQARRKNKNRVAALTDAEKKNIINFGKSTMKKRSQLIEKGAKATDAERLEYGIEAARMRAYVGGLVKDADMNYKDILTDDSKSATMRGIEAGWKGVTDVFGFAKSAVGAWDNSFVGRQGLKVLADNPKMWAKESARSFKNFAKGLKDDEAELLTEAYILSRPNNLNGMYKKMGLDVIGISEEAIPSRGPEDIPGVGRIFRASNAAYTGFAQRARVDTADAMLALSKDAGGDLSDPSHLKAIGSFANNLTGRGALGKAERIAEDVNKVFFSPRLLVSNLNYLTAHQLDPKADAFVKSRARKNIAKAAVGSAVALSLAEGLLDAEIERDPRSSDFGKIKIKNTRFDISGGTASLITLGARVVTQSAKSTSTKEITNFNEAGPFDQTFASTLMQFAENKLSPGAGAVADVIQKEMFGGEEVTAGNLLRDVSIPLSAQNWAELNEDENSAGIFGPMMAEIMGIGTINYGFDVDIKTKDSKKVNGFKDAVSKSEFEEADELVDESFTSWWGAVQNEPTYQQLSKDRRESLIRTQRDRIMDEIFSEYGYEYKRQSATSEEESLVEGLRQVGL